MLLTSEEFQKIITTATQRTGFPFPDILYGVASVESNFNPLAVRYEKHYKWLYFPEDVRPLGCSRETEVSLQKHSWGMFQMMGAVFRELGLKDWLTCVVADPQLQADYAARYLNKLYKRYGSIEDTVAAYNAGSPRRRESGVYVNQGYVDRVLQASAEYADFLAEHF
jgi:hypothetical protein